MELSFNHFPTPVPSLRSWPRFSVLRVRLRRRRAPARPSSLLSHTSVLVHRRRLASASPGGGGGERRLIDSRESNVTATRTVTFVSLVTMMSSVAHTRFTRHFTIFLACDRTFDDSLWRWQDPSGGAGRLADGWRGRASRLWEAFPTQGRSVCSWVLIMWQLVKRLLANCSTSFTR